jgi:phospholipid/cholesterol/gamma-HCH transport system substrate-binding protein
METRARYILMGFFALVVIVAGFGFVYWIENSGGLGERSVYQIRFDGTVSGLLVGSAVQFNGIRVGEVTDLSLVPEDPRQVIATIAIRADTPVRTDTQAGLVFGGLTGVPEIALTGGTPQAPQFLSSGSHPPLLAAEVTATTDWTAAARAAFNRVDSLLSNNSEALTQTISNLDTFSDALARNSESLDDIIAGLARLAGVRAGGKIEAYYDLSGATDFPALGKPPQGQLVVNTPLVPQAFDTQQLMLSSEDAARAAFPGAGWPDTVSRITQRAILRSLENAGYARAGGDFQGLAADHTLSISIDAFHILAGPEPRAEVGFSASVADNAGSILAARRFEAAVGVGAMEAKSAAEALAEAFNETERALVAWVFGVLEGT